jgi:hypothetical protein
MPTAPMEMMQSGSSPYGTQIKRHRGTIRAPGSGEPLGEEIADTSHVRLLRCAGRCLRISGRWAL